MEHGYGGLDGDPIDNSGWTPLIIAIYYNHADVVKLLLDRGADIYKMCPCQSFAPLYYGIMCGHKRILKLLLEKIEAKLQNSDDESIFHRTNWESENAFESINFKGRAMYRVQSKDDRIGEGKTLKMLLNHTLKRPIGEIDQVTGINLEANIIRYFAYAVCFIHYLYFVNDLFIIVQSLER